MTRPDMTPDFREWDAIYHAPFVPDIDLHQPRRIVSRDAIAGCAPLESELSEAQEL